MQKYAFRMKSIVSGRMIRPQFWAMPPERFVRPA